MADINAFHRAVSLSLSKLGSVLHDVFSETVGYLKCR